MLDRSETLGISPKSRPRDVFDEAIEAKELEKLSVALSGSVSTDCPDPARRNEGRNS